ncbi:hypothetical protein RF11_11208 [Thelohanellus kitauei]|uniref:Uncharacterized protein n=1 Tax=Thelohanellus kitauei TaxID=669202 RepID=A0A0C2INV5_THEKT|nr:hypothetical protein RF11_11208 [Thelohanellus kitauei]
MISAGIRMRYAPIEIKDTNIHENIQLLPNLNERNFEKNNFKKILKIIDKRLRDNPHDEIKVLVHLKNHPNKYEEYIPRLWEVARSKPQHNAVIEAIVTCCRMLKQGPYSLAADKLLIQLLDECVDPQDINKHTFDSKNFFNSYESNPHIHSSITLFKAIVGSYQELNLENKRNILIEKIETLKTCADPHVKFNYMFSIVEILFAVAEENFSICHFYVHLIIVALIDMSFKDDVFPRIALLKMFSLKHLCFHDHSQFNSNGYSNVKNILLETLPSPMEALFSVGLFRSAVESALGIIRFQSTSIQDIENGLVNAYRVGSWDSIENLIKMKYRIQMSYKAIYARTLVDYADIILNPTNFQRLKSQFRRNFPIPIFGKVYSAEKMPPIYIRESKFDVSEGKLFLVDNSDIQILHKYQPTSRQCTGEVKQYIQTLKALSIKFRQVLIDNTFKLSRFNNKTFEIEVLKDYQKECLALLTYVKHDLGSLDDLSNDFDFIMVDLPEQATIWLKYGFVQVIIEFYDDLSNTIENRPTTNLMEFEAFCTNLKIHIGQTLKSDSIEGYPEILRICSSVFELFTYIFMHANHIQMYTQYAGDEWKHLREKYLAKIKKIQTNILSVRDELPILIDHLKRPETSISFKDRYFGFLVDYIGEKYIQNTASYLKKYYLHVLENMMINMSNITSIET